MPIDQPKRSVWPTVFAGVVPLGALPLYVASDGPATRLAMDGRIPSSLMRVYDPLDAVANATGLDAALLKYRLCWVTPHQADVLRVEWQVMLIERQEREVHVE